MNFFAFQGNIDSNNLVGTSERLAGFNVQTRFLVKQILDFLFEVKISSSTSTVIAYTTSSLEAIVIEAESV